MKKRRDLVPDGYEFSKLCFVKDGFAARYKLLRNGKRQIVNFIVPGDVVGLPGSFLDRAANSVIAVSDMTLQVCPLEVVRRALLPAAEIRPGCSAGSRCRRRRTTPSTSSMSAAARRSSGWRICCSKSIPGSSRSARAAESAFTLPFTQEMMSDALGLSVPHLNRMLTKLRADGLIAVTSGTWNSPISRAMQLLAQFQPARPARIPLPADAELV